MSHLRLLNALIESAPTAADAQILHADVFASGLERALLVRELFSDWALWKKGGAESTTAHLIQTLRKCNKLYYPAVFFEMSRYLHLADMCEFELPSKLAKLREATLPRPNGAPAGRF